MKALIYDPYLDTMGGGERYVLTFASALKSSGYIVTFAWPDRRTFSSGLDRFNLESDFTCDASAYDDFARGSLISKWNLTKHYDLVFFISDGSFPFLFGKKNLVHFQVPFTKIGGIFLINQIKSLFIHKLVFNSNFTAGVIKRQLPYISSTVLYPPIDTENFKPGKKEDVILSVARFDSPSHAKRQDVLIEAFRAYRQKGGKFKLVLAGGVMGEGGESYIETLKKQADGLPISFVVNSDFGQLKKLYAKAKIFWHAAGFEIDEKTNPEKVEHFGITTVEAMAAGAVPVVINKGGQREIITPDTGYLCDTVEGIVDSTLSLANSPEKLKRFSKNAVVRSQHFNTERFIQEINAIA